MFSFSNNFKIHAAHKDLKSDWNCIREALSSKKYADKWLIFSVRKAWTCLPHKIRVIIFNII